MVDDLYIFNPSLDVCFKYRKILLTAAQCSVVGG